MNLIPIKAVVTKTDTSRSTIYRLEKKGLFPKRRQISSGRKIGWIESEVDEWIADRPVVTPESAKLAAPKKGGSENSTALTPGTVRSAAPRAENGRKYPAERVQTPIA